MIAVPTTHVKFERNYPRGVRLRLLNFIGRVEMSQRDDAAGHPYAKNEIDAITGRTERDSASTSVATSSAGSPRCDPHSKAWPSRRRRLRDETATCTLKYLATVRPPKKHDARHAHRLKQRGSFLAGAAIHGLRFKSAERFELHAMT
jgi:hypothetical protein